LSAEAVVGLADLRFTNYEVFGVVEEFGPGYVLGFPKLSRCPLKLLLGWRIYDLRITIYEVFGVVEEFGPGYVLGFPSCRLSAEAVVGLADLRFTNYEVFGVVEEFGPGYVLGFPKLSRCPLKLLLGWRIYDLPITIYEVFWECSVGSVQSQFSVGSRLKLLSVGGLRVVRCVV